MIRSRNLAIRLEEVSVIYQIPSERIFSIKEYLIRKATFKLTSRKLVALNNVNIEIPQGEVLGIIGRNGAGKSTLMKVISRVLHPSKGKVSVYGRIAPLLTLGAGFNLELNGKENIYLNGAILGLSKFEIEDSFEEIISFSGLENFINSPLRTFSSGMIARLGFAVATSFHPDILLIDEILSVGDEDFKKKSYSRIMEYKEQGVTILIVSHNLDVIQKLCDRVIWLENGIEKMTSHPKEVIPVYRAGFKNKQN